jgi:hypothetical protein
LPRVAADFGARRLPTERERAVGLGYGAVAAAQRKQASSRVHATVITLPGFFRSRVRRWMRRGGAGRVWRSAGCGRAAPPGACRACVRSRAGGRTARRPRTRIRRANLEPVLLIDPCTSDSPDCCREGTRPSHDPSCTARGNLVTAATSSTMISAEGVSILRNARSRRTSGQNSRVERDPQSRSSSARDGRSPRRRREGCRRTPHRC